MSALDLSGWLTTPEVCARLGITERTLERQRDKWQSRMRPREGKRPERVYDPAEVAAREQKTPTELVSNGPMAALPALPTPSAGVIPALPTSVPVISGWEALISIDRFVRDHAPPKAEPPLFVSLDEASAITGLARSYLQRLIRDGKLPANRGGGRRAIRVRRRDLDEIGDVE